MTSDIPCTYFMYVIDNPHIFRSDSVFKNMGTASYYISSSLCDLVLESASSFIDRFHPTYPNPTVSIEKKNLFCLIDQHCADCFMLLIVAKDLFEFSAFRALQALYSELEFFLCYSNIRQQGEYTFPMD